MKISELCDGEISYTLVYFEEFCDFFNLNYEQSKFIYKDYYQEAQIRGLDNFTAIKALL